MRKICVPAGAQRDWPACVQMHSPGFRSLKITGGVRDGVAWTFSAWVDRHIPGRGNLKITGAVGDRVGWTAFPVSAWFHLVQASFALR